MVTKERFIGEEIRPLQEEFDYTASAPGEPALPRVFRWRGATVEILHILKRWKSISGCRHGSSDRYVRRHWYRIRSTDNRLLTIYFDRQFTIPRGQKRRWWLFSQTVEEGGEG